MTNDQPKTWFSYQEWECNNEHLNPGHGEGSCLQMHEQKKGEQFPECRKCADVLREGQCPRGHKSPYMERGERS